MLRLTRQRQERRDMFLILYAKEIMMFCWFMVFILDILRRIAKRYNL